MKKKGNGRFGFCVFPGYKWCGPGCNGPGTPINSVDAACKKHDLCYKRYGNQCECDRAFLRSLRSEINPYTKMGRQAQLIYEYMKLQTFIKCGSIRK